MKRNASGDLECYDGTIARTKFWRQTTLLPVEMIEIIAVVVVIALLALLVPFVLTKRKITAHLRDVYENHKYKGYLRSVETLVQEERARRAQLKAEMEAEGKGASTSEDGKVVAISKNDDEDVALMKEESNKHDDKKKK